MAPISEETSEVKKVALIGSSGGGTATLGHTEASVLLSTIHRHLCLIGARLDRAIYITLHSGKSMDSAQAHEDMASLTVVKNSASAATTEFQCQCIATETMERINERASQLQKELALQVSKGTVHALICISMHVPLFETVLQAASDRSLPVTGSGGSSLAQASVQFPGFLLAGNAGGSVATTTQTRAVSYTYSLAQAFERTSQYRPWQLSTSSSGPSWTSILNGTLPAFWAVMVTKFLLRKGKELFTLNSVLEKELDMIQYVLNHFTLPTVCAMLAATSFPSANNNSTSPTTTTSSASLIMASAIASSGCRDSVVAGLVAGYLVHSTMERWVIYPCIFANVPATMTTLLAAGGTGSAVGLLALVTLAPISRVFTSTIRFLIHFSVTESFSIHPHLPVVSAFMWGCLSCWSSKVGYYHAVHLPLILIELEQGGGSFLGAVDELTLVLVSAGVCAAKVLSSRTTIADRALCQRGLLINLLAGDFVEVCYPYMENSLMVNISGYAASGLSCAVLVLLASDDNSTPPFSFAYLPWIGSIILSDQNWYAMVCASLVAFFIPFIATVTAGSVSPNKKEV